MKKYIYIFVLFILSNYCVAQEGVVPHATIGKITIEKHYQQDMPILLEAEPFSLLSDSGSLMHDLSLQFSVLSDNQLALMPGDMVNVMGELANGYRLLPNGEHFSRPAVITLPYDPYRIPTGYHPTDIYTYYYDDDIAHWKQLERAYVDTVAHTISSYTTHFTDFANAVIKVPEMPESKAYVPTEMSDQPDVNPLQGIPMVAAPTANNKGTAELSYPIELPAGRLGMQPNVDLHYSSAGGNGVLGVGWTLNTPAITLDTRWGVPRYDLQYESEQYLVNGASVLLRKQDGTAIDLPYQNNSLTTRKTGKVRFYARDTKNQDRMLRVGTNPSNYWWAVTDRNGITTYYGRKFDPLNPDSITIEEESVIRTENGCIAYWAATASVDVHGNYVLYTNEKQNNTIYVRQIDYTGNCYLNIAPTYRVHFQYKDRGDVSSVGRLGVLQHEEYLLCHVLVQYIAPDKDELDYTDNIAAYFLQYDSPQEKNLFKSRLIEVVMLDSVHDLYLNEVCELDDILKGYVNRNSLADEMLEKVHDEDYSLYNEMREILSLPYGQNSIPASTTHFSYADAPLLDNLFGTDVAISSLGRKNISSSHGTSWGIGGTIAAGPGPDVATTMFSGGANYNYSRNKGRCTSMFIDLNGDGLQDLVYEENHIVWYCKQYKQGTQVGFASPVQLQGLSRLSQEVSNTHSWGLQLSFGVNLSYTNPITTSYTDVYFSDVNADGLPDMIDEDRILINHLVNGTPHFGVFTGVEDKTISVHNSSCHRIIMDGEVDEHIECDLQEVFVQSFSQNEFFENNDSSQLGPEFVVDENIPYPDMLDMAGEVVSIAGQDSVYNEIDTRISESLGDNLVKLSPRRRLNSMGSSDNSIDEDLIYRLDGDSVRAYRLEYVCRPKAIDPQIDMVRVWVAPRHDTLLLNDRIVLLHDTFATQHNIRTADGVAYTIQHCRSVSTQVDNMHLHADSYDILHSGVINANDTTIKNWSGQVVVEEGDVLMFRLRSKDNNRFDRTNWNHVLQSRQGVVYDSQRDFICTGDSYFRAHNSGSVILTIAGNINGNESVNLRITQTGQVNAVLDTILHPGDIDIPSRTFNVSAQDDVKIYLSPNGMSEPTWSNIRIVPCLQYVSDFLVNESSQEHVRDTVVYYPDVQINHSSLYAADSPYRKIFGPMHKGWGMFAYQDINHHDTINIDSLVNTQLLAAMRYSSGEAPNCQLDPSALNSANATSLSYVNNVLSEYNVYNPIADTCFWVPLRVDNRTAQWIAYGNMGCIGQNLHSNAREIIIEEQTEDIIEYDSSIPFTSGEERVNNFVRKQSRSTQHSFSYGALILNDSYSFGSYNAVVDYMDMNGDGYPDFLGSGGIQYSMPWGGIGRFLWVKNYSAFSSNNNAAGTAFSACPTILSKSTGNSLRDGKFHLNATMGASIGDGNSSTRIQFMDMNADGLPDKIDIDNQTIQYNLGYEFSESYPFSGCVSEGTSANGSASVGITPSLSQSSTSSPFSFAQVSISGGVSNSLSENIMTTALIDINGDGKPDRITKSGSTVMVAYNLGGGNFGSARPLSNINCIGKDITAGLTTTLGVTAGFTILGIVRLDFGVQSSPYGESSTVGGVQMIDMNGDGFVDYVYKDTDGSIHVRYNQIGNANLLTSVINPTGQEIQLEYSLSSPTPMHKSRQWELRKVKRNVPNHPIIGARHSILAIEYKNAYYDNYEKTDYGYESVETIENDKKVNRYTYLNHSISQIGELKENVVMDSDGKLYLRHVHEVRYKEINSTAEYDMEPGCNDANSYVLQDGYWTEYYEQEHAPQITTRYNIFYDSIHNMVRYRDDGDISVPNDDWSQEITYLPSVANNMISLPSKEEVFSAGGQTLRESYIYYSTSGQPAHISFEDRGSGAVATTHLHYDSVGNVIAVISPEDSNGFHNWTKFEYDTVTYTHVVAMDNPYNACTYKDYDYRWGLPLRSVDPAGNEIRYTYDYKGRLSSILSPIELDQGKKYSIKYDYNLINHNLKRIPPYHETHVYKDIYDSIFAQREVSIYDPNGRMMQKKHLAEVEGHDEWVVDGAEEWDSFGRTVEQEFPFLAQDSPYVYEAINHIQAIVRTSYDALDRPLIQTNSDGLTKNCNYEFGIDVSGETRLMTRIEDENGTTTRILKSPQDWQIQLIAGDSSITYFEYSPIGELSKVTDADGYQTTYTYDMLGRMTSRTHPDAGETKMEYDLTGNLTRKQTANLQLTSEDIQYVYSYGRLTNILYPHHVENNITLTYDSAGRIAIREDGVGHEEYVYDRLGNISQSIRRIVVPTESHAYVFRTLYKYDSFGRMRDLIYPDGEVLHYGYTTGGLLKNVSGYKNGYQNVYLQDRYYDEQGRKTYQLFGNGVWSQYSYDQDRQWLVELYTELPNFNALQDIAYGYDSVGNIVMLKQNAGVEPFSGFGGGYRIDYTYDRQYRLINSNGDADYWYSFGATYSPSGRLGTKITRTNAWLSDLMYGYDSGRLTHQIRTLFDPQIGHTAFYWDANGNLAQAVSCDQKLSRLHEWDEENRLKFVLGDRHAGYYGYDGNGNRIYKLAGVSSVNRINAGEMNAQVSFDDLTLYPSPYMVVDRNGYTKHYYAGTERLATVIGGGGFADMVSPKNKLDSQHDWDIVNAFNSYYKDSDPFNHKECLSTNTQTEDITGKEDSNLAYRCDSVSLAYLDVLSQSDILYNVVSGNEQEINTEKDVYFYHGDHLGSANWITDNKGDVSQYIRYAPYGELLANQRTSSYDERYKFTGKERDWESGYDFFGARYYWGMFGHWLSVDPLVDKYLWISPYAYCNWNPIKYVDPDGRYSVNKIPQNFQETGLATHKDADRWLKTHDPTKNSSILYVAFHFSSKASSEQVKSIILKFDKELKEWSAKYEQGDLLNSNDVPKQIVLQACYGAQVAEELAKENPGIYVSGATGQLSVENTLNGYRDTKNKEKIEVPFLKFFKREKEIDGQWNTYYCNPKTNRLSVFHYKHAEPPTLEYKNKNYE